MVLHVETPGLRLYDRINHPYISTNDGQKQSGKLLILGVQIPDFGGPKTLVWGEFL
jgi:hypothetical protein